MKELISILETSADLADAPELLEKLVRHAEHSGASDIHIQTRQPHAEIAFRLDGVMTAPWSLPAELAERVCGRIKFLSRLKTYQQSLPQDGRIDKSAFGIANDLRVATYPTVTGEKIVLRIFGESRVRELGELELPPDLEEVLAGFLARAAGMLLLTGPAGSGKTTTIYACLQHLAKSGGRHIITVEDPVEQIIRASCRLRSMNRAGSPFPRPPAISYARIHRCWSLVKSGMRKPPLLPSGRP